MSKPRYFYYNASMTDMAVCASNSSIGTTLATLEALDRIKLRGGGIKLIGICGNVLIINNDHDTVSKFVKYAFNCYYPVERTVILSRGLYGYGKADGDLLHKASRDLYCDTSDLWDERSQIGIARRELLDVMIEAFTNACKILANNNDK